MKKLISLLTLCLLMYVASAQSYYTVYGKVISALTKQPLQGASVFAQNTTLGTATDAEGNFKLSVPEGGYTLVITFTGYNSETKRISNADAIDRSVVYEMTEKQKEMEEVSVVATAEVKDGWDKYGQFFIEKFIGQSTNSARCELKNKEVLKFYFYKRKNKLKVVATEPLLIENASLGYNIRYSLDSFIHEYNSEVSLYTGYPLFEEKIPDNNDQYAEWMRARVIAYKGSTLHFMRSAYNKTLQQEGFQIQFLVTENGIEKALPVKKFYDALRYSKDDSTALVELLPFQKRVGILYINEKPEPGFGVLFPNEPVDFQFSIVGFLQEEGIGIERNGYYFDQNDLSISGYWTWERIADQLPYNYRPVME
jgi:hypothetical protein